MAADAVPSPEPDDQDLLRRVQELTDELDALGADRAREVAEELIAAMLELYGAGLERILELVDASGPAGAGIRARMVEDGVVASLLLIHDLYPIDLETRVQEALATVRPYLESHGGDVELLGIEDGVARLRLVGHCKGCPASAATLELAIEQALQEAAPDLLGLEVEGVATPAATGRPIPRPISLPVVNVTGQAPRPAPTWLPLEDAGTVDPGAVRALTARGVDLIVANVNGSLLAYRSPCPGCGTPLESAALDGGILTCAGCDRAYDLPHAGRTVGDAGVPLEPIPLLRRRAGPAVEVAMAQ